MKMLGYVPVPSATECRPERESAPSRCVLPSLLSLAVLAWAGCSDHGLLGPNTTDEAGDLARVSLSTVEVSAPRDLGTLGGGRSFAYGVNDQGWVVGRSLTSGGQIHAFLLKDNTQLIDVADDLGVLSTSFSFSRAQNVSNNGTVVGFSFDGGLRGFVWTDAGGMVSIGVPGGGISTRAFSVNDAGEVAGTARLSADRAARWRAGSWTVFTDGSSSNATDINKDGRVIGSVVPTTHAFNAVYWDPPGLARPLETLSGNSEALGINNCTQPCSQIVGYSYDIDDIKRPVIWTDQDVEALDIGSAASGEARDINDAGYVVGVRTTASFQNMATLWTPAGEMIDLGALGGASANSEAEAINANGDIVGHSTDANGETHATLWQIGGASTPTPEELIADLLAEITTLVSTGALSADAAEGLIAKLEAAAKKLAAGKTKTAVNVLGAFINQAEAFVNSGVLTPAEGQQLIDLAQAAIDQLRAPTT